MKTNITENPAEDAGAYIKQKLEEHVDHPILFLVSGGSALQVLSTITSLPLYIKDTLTVATTDERFTFDTQGNNFLQLKETEFFKELEGSHVHYIDSNPQQGETFELFATRIKTAFEDFFLRNSNAYTIALLGIGEDGHTASIFPSTEQNFNELYPSDELYVDVTQLNLQYPYRTTITPCFIEEKVDDVVLFAVGSVKCDNILNYMHNKNFERHQIPALIPAQHPQSVLFTDCATLL